MLFLRSLFATRLSYSCCRISYCRWRSWRSRCRCSYCILLSSWRLSHSIWFCWCCIFFRSISATFFLAAFTAFSVPWKLNRVFHVWVFAEYSFLWLIRQPVFLWISFIFWIKDVFDPNITCWPFRPVRYIVLHQISVLSLNENSRFYFSENSYFKSDEIFMRMEI